MHDDRQLDLAAGTDRAFGYQLGLDGIDARRLGGSRDGDQGQQEEQQAEHYLARYASRAL
jgi:hypothetical protein